MDDAADGSKEGRREGGSFKNRYYDSHHSIRPFHSQLPPPHLLATFTTAFLPIQIGDLFLPPAPPGVGVVSCRVYVKYFIT